nr:MAG TPA: hypothetical protein [Caudoviricetes sp.]
MDNLEKLIYKAKIELGVLNEVLNDVDKLEGDLTVGLVLACVKGRKQGLENVIKWREENA